MIRRMIARRYKIVERKSDSTSTYFLELCYNINEGNFMIYYPPTRTFTGGFKSQAEAIVHLGLICAERNATFEEVEIDE